MVGWDSDLITLLGRQKADQIIFSGTPASWRTRLRRITDPICGVDSILAWVSTSSAEKNVCSSFNVEAAGYYESWRNNGFHCFHQSQRAAATCSAGFSSVDVGRADLA